MMGFMLQCMSPGMAAHRVESLRYEGSDAIGAKRHAEKHRKRVDLTKMTQLGSGVCIAAVEMKLICVGGGLDPCSKPPLCPLSKHSFEPI
jgi:hypothetical protein